MSSGVPRAAADDSRSTPTNRASTAAARGARAALAIAGAGGVAALVVATFTPIIELSVGDGVTVAAEVDRSLTGLDRHSAALLLLAAGALVMLVGALRGARLAMLALAALGIAVLAIAIGSDVPDLERTGPVGELYEDARASAGTGFYAETLGGALLLIAGGGLLVLAPPRTAARGGTDYQR